ncbi:MAG TPA: 3D domain-containing protein [Chloroflexota bacterium]|nr:3D domain-containing protein [Chloroflexota bacterium]
MISAPYSAPTPHERREAGGTLTTSGLTAAVCAAALLVAPMAYAQEQPAALPIVVATVTGYATGGDGGTIGDLTASGIRCHWGTVAADWRLYPPGTRLLIEGFPNDVFVVEDSGGAVRGNIFDVWFPDLAAARAFGTQKLKVTILGAADP